MCTTSETCRINSVIKTALNNLHQAGPNKTHTSKRITKTHTHITKTPPHTYTHPHITKQVDTTTTLNIST